MARVLLGAALWGGLGDYIDLASLIFAKLPLDAFFRLRVVCKEWNRLASDRAFLLEHFSSLLQPPYFVVDTRSGARLLQRRDAGGWTWTTRLPPMRFASSGLLMVHSSDFNRVLDLHTRVVYDLPVVDWGLDEDGDEELEDVEERVVGMIVDATVKPYAFRVIMGYQESETRIYDSRSELWTQKDSTVFDCITGDWAGCTVSAVCDDILYIRIPNSFSLHTYNVRRDEWSVEVLPGYEAHHGHGYEHGEWMCCDFGVWEGRLYMVGLSFLSPCRFLVWELSKQDDYDYRRAATTIRNQDYDGTWPVFGGIWETRHCMPRKQWNWMFAGKQEKLIPKHWAEYFKIKSRFCGEYVLVYNSVACENFTEERAVMYNLKSGRWAKVDLPSSVV